MFDVWWYCWFGCWFLRCWVCLSFVYLSVRVYCPVLVNFSEHVMTAEREDLEGEEFVVTSPLSSNVLIFPEVDEVTSHPQCNRKAPGLPCLTNQLYRLSFDYHGKHPLQLGLLAKRVRAMSRYAFFQAIDPLPLIPEKPKQLVLQ